MASSELMNVLGMHDDKCTININSATANQFGLKVDTSRVCISYLLFVMVLEALSWEMFYVD